MPIVKSSCPGPIPFELLRGQAALRAWRCDIGDVMAIAERTKQYLDNKLIIYDVRALPAFSSVARAAELAGISAAAAVKTEVLKDEIGALLVVLPATHELDIDALSKLLLRRMETADEAQIKQLFSDCLHAFVPPFGEAYGVRVVVDDSLVAREELYFAAGKMVWRLRSPISRTASRR